TVSLPAYTIVDLRIAKKINLVDLEFKAENLFDAVYSEAVGTYFDPNTFASENRNYPMPGRRYSVGVKWEI
ncbi:MAG: TonB-dependent receptor, partial [bacterium]